MRITANRETAEEVTVDVFHDVWRRAARYQEADGTVLGWLMNQARSRAIDRSPVRAAEEARASRFRRSTGRPRVSSSPDELIAFKEQSRALRSALDALSPDERQAIEAAFFLELTYAEVADQLNQPLGTIKTRIRSGLQKLRQALADARTENVSSPLDRNMCKEIRCRYLPMRCRRFLPTKQLRWRRTSHRARNAGRNWRRCGLSSTASLSGRVTSVRPPCVAAAPPCAQNRRRGR